MAIAVKTAQEWWSNFEPLMREIQTQLLTQLEPLVRAGADGLKQLELKLKPQKEQAAVLLAEWNALAVERAQSAYVASREWWIQQQPRIEAWQKQLEPLTQQLREKAVTEAKKLSEQYESTFKPAAIAFGEKAAAQCKVASVVVQEKTKTWAQQGLVQLTLWAKQMEEPMKLFQAWLIQAAHCVCLPIAPEQIKYKSMGQPDYPLPVTAPNAQVAPIP